MIENATNLTNAMNLATQLERMPSVYTNLKTFFLGSYTGNVLLAILIWVTIMLFFFEYRVGRKQKHIERIQQEYGKLLKPDAVKLEYKGGVLKYLSEKDLDFESFLSEVKKQKKYRKYKIDALYEKLENAANDYKKLVENVPEGIKEIVDHTLKKEGFGSMLWYGEDNKPLDSYVDMSNISFYIANIVRGELIIPNKARDGQHVLQCPSTFVKTTSKDKNEKLKEVFEKIAKYDEIKELIEKPDRVKNDLDQTLKEYNDKLAEIIRDLRMYPPRGVFKR